ncbi:MAG: hypothetical protein LBC07_03280 [Elusimicrobiota bacterium]|jgi:hypothetical protein|nr:hypothetical protein [Elusimicrobiota bacterium]
MKQNNFKKVENVNSQGGATAPSNEGLVKPWMPTYKWLGIFMACILVFLVIVFFLGNIILADYMVTPPMEITPWLDKDLPNTSILGI